MGVIFSEQDAQRIRKAVQAFERGEFSNRGPKRRSFNYGSDGGSIPGDLPAVPAYAVRNNANQSIGAYSSGKIQWTTQIHRKPDDTTAYTLSTYQVTIVEPGMYHIGWNIPVDCTVTTAFWNLTLIEDPSGASTTVQAISPVRPPGLATGTYYSHTSLAHTVSSSSIVYEVQIANGDGTGITVLGSSVAGGIGARLDIWKIRDL